MFSFVIDTSFSIGSQSELSKSSEQVAFDKGFNIEVVSCWWKLGSDVDPLLAGNLVFNRKKLID